jgi:hypothetical protein
MRSRQIDLWWHAAVIVAAGLLMNPFAVVLVVVQFWR